jgi:hypothetical protein
VPVPVSLGGPAQSLPVGGPPEQGGEDEAGALPSGQVQSEVAGVGVGVVSQACVLHACVGVSVGQAAPPLAACVVTTYDWDCVPLPHVAEHADHWPQLPVQSTAAAGATSAATESPHVPSVAEHLAQVP